MSKFEVKNTEGKAAAEVELAPAVYGIEPNINVMHRLCKRYSVMYCTCQ